jgi:hypothetical protein
MAISLHCASIAIELRTRDLEGIHKIPAPQSGALAGANGTIMYLSGTPRVGYSVDTVKLAVISVSAWVRPSLRLVAPSLYRLQDTVGQQRITDDQVSARAFLSYAQTCCASSG